MEEKGNIYLSLWQRASFSPSYEATIEEVDLKFICQAIMMHERQEDGLQARRNGGWSTGHQ